MLLSCVQVAPSQIRPSRTVVADLFHLLRSEPGNDRSPCGWIQRVELVMNVLHGQIGFLVLLA